MEQLEHYEEMELVTQRWRQVASYEWPALPPAAMVRCQSKLPLRAMSEFVAMQWQGSVLRTWECPRTAEANHKIV